MVSALIAVVLVSQIPHTPSSGSSGLETPELAAAKQAYLDARKNKVDLESAAFAFGEVVVNSLDLKPKDKYPLALALFRQTLAINPDHETAKEWENTIIQIYAGLGKEPDSFDLNSIR